MLGFIRDCLAAGSSCEGQRLHSCLSSTRIADMFYQASLLSVLDIQKSEVFHSSNCHTSYEILAGFQGTKTAHSNRQKIHIQHCINITFLLKPKRIS